MAGGNNEREQARTHLPTEPDFVQIRCHNTHFAASNSVDDLLWYRPIYFYD